jgi:hypothetical protein
VENLINDVRHLASVTGMFLTVGACVVIPVVVGLLAIVAKIHNEVR